MSSPKDEERPHDLDATHDREHDETHRHADGDDANDANDEVRPPPQTRRRAITEGREH